VFAIDLDISFVAGLDIIYIAFVMEVKPEKCGKTQFFDITKY